jgi:hypothetical protein
MDTLKNDNSKNNIQPKVIHILERYKFYITIFIMFFLLLVFYIFYSIYSFLKKKFNVNYKSKTLANVSDHFVFQIISVLTIIIGFYIGLLSLYNTIIQEVKQIIQINCSEKVKF